MWMQPIFDNLAYLLSTRGSHLDHAESRTTEQRIDQLLDGGKLVLEPLTYIRGRSIPHQFIIVDEAQNLTPHEVKTIVSRVGEGTKIVLTGDINQIDNPYLDASSQRPQLPRRAHEGPGIYGHVTLTKSERSDLASLAAESPVAAHAAGTDSPHRRRGSGKCRPTFDWRPATPLGHDSRLRNWWLRHGCDDGACCTAVCAIDAFCCNVQWDGSCASIAAAIWRPRPRPACPLTFDQSCFAGSDVSGCDSAACCETVCDVDPFCCDVQWDLPCAQLAAALCEAPPCTASGEQPCVLPSSSPGCADAACCGIVCDALPYCCEIVWDQQCTITPRCCAVS